MEAFLLVPTTILARPSLVHEYVFQTPFPLADMILTRSYTLAVM